MFKNASLALLASASCLTAAIDSARAFDGAPPQDPTVIYAREPQAAPMRAAYAERSNMGGGFIEFLFGDPQQARGRYQQGGYPPEPLYQPQPSYDPQQAMPMMQPQVMRQDQYGGQYGVQYGEPVQRPMDPKFEKQEVEYHGSEAAGTIVIDTPNKFLYLVQGNGRALRYGVGVGRPGFAWAGVKTISAKREWPDWTPPSEMLARRPDLPRHMEGGPENPLGARAMYLGSSLYRIHGSNEPWTIGTNVSSGCIRMRNEDVIDLYGRVNVGTRVIVL
jgi:lipoprotein-anchoring transpeptidase ErfK/SrfK